MKRLQQDKYKPDHNEFAASLIDVLAPYQHIADGFFTWECGKCGAEASGRTCGWPIMGLIETCISCKAVNLLVSTCVDELNALRQKNWDSKQRDEELDRLREIKRLNDNDIALMRRKIMLNIEATMRDEVLSSLRETK